MKLNKLIWYFPLYFFIHDFEEILTIEKVLTKYSSLIPFSITTIQFTVAFIILWVASLFVCYQATTRRRIFGIDGITAFAFLVTGILLGNAISHVIQFIYLQSYVPGIVTSVTILLPYALYTVNYLVKKSFITSKQFGLFLVLGLIAQGPLAFTALLIAKILA